MGRASPLQLMFMYTGSHAATLQLKMPLVKSEIDTEESRTDEWPKEHFYSFLSTLLFGGEEAQE